MANPGSGVAELAPTPRTVDLLAPTLRQLGDLRASVTGDPVALRRAAATWRAVAQALRDLGARVERAGHELHGAGDGPDGLVGRTGAVADATAARLRAWVADAARRAEETAATCDRAADLVERARAILDAVELHFVQGAVDAVNRELARPSVDVMLRAAAAVVPHARAALAGATTTVNDVSRALRVIAADLRTSAGCVSAQGTPYAFDVSLFGVPLFPRSWLPTWQPSTPQDYLGLVWPEDPTRRNLALSSGVINVVAETKRVSLPYGLMTLPTTLFRDVLTDTSEPILDTFHDPIANGLAHAGWGIGGTYASDWLAGAATDRWGAGIGDWLTRHRFLAPGEQFSLHTGATRHIAGISGGIGFALTVKDPLFVELGLSSVDERGFVRPLGALGEAASLTYDVGTVAGMSALGMGAERWQAGELTHLTPEERMRHVSRTVCAEWFVGQGSVLLERSLEEHLSPLARGVALGTGAASVGTAAFWCGSDGHDGGTPPTSGGSLTSAVAPVQLPQEQASLLRQWRAWSHDPELSPSYAASPDYRHQALLGDALGELGLVGAVAAGDALLGAGGATGTAGAVWQALRAGTAAAPVSAPMLTAP